MSKPIFDFQNPNPSLEQELKLVQERAEKYFLECMETKLKTLRDMSDNKQKTGWAYKALINSAANFLVVGETLMSGMLDEASASMLNFTFSALASQYVGAVLIELAKIETKKKMDAEIDLLERIHGLEG